VLAEIAAMDFKDGVAAYREYVRRGGDRSIQGVLMKASQLARKPRGPLEYRHNMGRLARDLGREVRRVREDGEGPSRASKASNAKTEWVTYQEACELADCTSGSLRDAVEAGHVIRRRRTLPYGQRGLQYEYNRARLLRWKEHGNTRDPARKPEPRFAPREKPRAAAPRRSSSPPRRYDEVFEKGKAWLDDDMAAGKKKAAKELKPPKPPKQQPKPARPEPKSDFDANGTIPPEHQWTVAGLEFVGRRLEENNSKLDALQRLGGETNGLLTRMLGKLEALVEAWEPAPDRPTPPELVDRNGVGASVQEVSRFTYKIEEAPAETER